MRIAVDAMGGDHAPDVVVDGAVQAARLYGTHVILVGDRDVLAAQLERHDVKGLPLSVRHASEQVEMHESPSAALRRKKDSSMRVALDLVRAGEADAAVSAGNSGAFMAIAMLVLRLMPGVERPAIATLVPSTHGPTVVLDVGANVDCQPHHLVQFAVMGEVFAHYLLDIERPKVGLLSNGSEDTKGTDLTRSAHEMLQKLNINYLGYVEGRDIFNGEAEVIVTDGFTGNVLLKTSEGVAKAITQMLKEEIQASWVRKLGYLLCKGAFDALRKRVDYREVGGAPLLGVNGIAIICHGSSNATAMRNAIREASDLAEKRINHHMQRLLEKNEDSHHWHSKKERRFWANLKHKLLHHRRNEHDAADG